MNSVRRKLALLMSLLVVAALSASLAGCAAEVEPADEEPVAQQEESTPTESSGTEAPPEYTSPSVAALTDEEVAALDAYAKEWVRAAQSGELVEGEVGITGPVIIYVEEGVDGVPTNSIDFESSPQRLQQSRYDWYKISHEKFARTTDQCTQIIWVGGRTSVSGTYEGTSIEGIATITFLRIIDTQTGTVSAEQITATQSPVQSIDRNTDLSTTKGEYYPYSAYDEIQALLGE